MLTIAPDGQTPDKPTVLGKPNDEPPIHVYATGMFKSLRKGEQRWVTGDAVGPALDSGVLYQIGSLAERDYAEPAVAPEPAAAPPAPVPEPTDVEKHLVDMSKSQLVKLAQKVDLEGRSAMDKSELYEHLRRHPNVHDHLD